MRLEWETSFPQLLVEIEEHLQQSRVFFNGAQVFLEVGQRPVLQHDMEQLAVILERYNVTLQGVISAPPSQTRRPPAVSSPIPVLDPNTTLHVERRTVRSGEKIAAEGHVIAALHLAPIQLRIAAYIARPPEVQSTTASAPQLARIDRNNIVVEAWDRGRAFQQRG